MTEWHLHHLLLASSVLGTGIVAYLSYVTQRSQMRRGRYPAPRRRSETRAMKRRRSRDGRHNHLDYACVYWIGDLRPCPHDKSNTDFGGGSTSTSERRCVVCRPFTEVEAKMLLGEVPDPEVCREPDCPEIDTGIESDWYYVRPEGGDLMRWCPRHAWVGEFLTGSSFALERMKREAQWTP